MCFDQLYSMEEVALRNGKNGARTWLIIKNSVYDLTEFLDKHPGGSDLILECAGKDATSAFRDSGHSMDANQMLKTYKIGELAIMEESSRAGSFKSNPGDSVHNANETTTSRKHKKRV
ncbi:cytochrome b5 [Condylostylus longicornis]|uniref:cytochrome b5 n=1 Tax=Condylostylus longicornis TaxID=2530218 RepID=UPI00244DC034|nr:cytochrome b5 [Condylostylus longicornis]